MPQTGVPFQPQLHHRYTETVAFSFEKRDANRKHNREQKLREIEEEERRAREFQATVNAYIITE